MKLSINQNFAFMCFGFALGMVFTTIGFMVERTLQTQKRKAPARAANTDKRQAVKYPHQTASIVAQNGGFKK